MTETVQVTAESPLIAITQSARATSIRGDEIDKMPKGRDFVTLVTQASGREHGGQVRHERDHDRRLVRRREPLDHRRRRDHQHPEHGSQGKTMVTDFVDEVQVKSSGYTAEYGGSTGGVINVLTKSGTQPVARRRGCVYYQPTRSTATPAGRCG